MDCVCRHSCTVLALESRAHLGEETMRERERERRSEGRVSYYSSRERRVSRSRDRNERGPRCVQHTHARARSAARRSCVADNFAHSHRLEAERVAVNEAVATYVESQFSDEALKVFIFTGTPAFLCRQQPSLLFSGVFSFSFPSHTHTPVSAAGARERRLETRLFEVSFSLSLSQAGACYASDGGLEAHFDRRPTLFHRKNSPTGEYSGLLRVSFVEKDLLGNTTRAAILSKRESGLSRAPRQP